MFIVGHRVNRAYGKNEERLHCLPYPIPVFLWNSMSVIYPQSKEIGQLDPIFLFWSPFAQSFISYACRRLVGYLGLIVLAIFISGEGRGLQFLILVISIPGIHYELPAANDSIDKGLKSLFCHDIGF